MTYQEEQEESVAWKNPDTADIIAKHELQLKQMRAEYYKKLEEERKAKEEETRP
jgi:hypothetical protein